MSYLYREVLDFNGESRKIEKVNMDIFHDIYLEPK